MCVTSFLTSGSPWLNLQDISGFDFSTRFFNSKLEFFLFPLCKKKKKIFFEKPRTKCRSFFNDFRQKQQVLFSRLSKEKNLALQWTKKLQKSIVVNSKNLIYFIFHNKGNLFFAFRQLTRNNKKIVHSLLLRTNWKQKVTKRKVVK